MRDSKGRFINGHSTPIEWRESWSSKNKQYRHTEEAKQNISKSLIGNTRNLGKIRLNQRGENHWNWKGGKHISEGYIKVLFNGKYVYEHHKVWCEANEFPIIPHGCVVHHRDMNGTNNIPDNLVLLPKQLHDELHWDIRKKGGD